MLRSDVLSTAANLLIREPKLTSTPFISVLKLSNPAFLEEKLFKLLKCEALQ